MTAIERVATAVWTGSVARGSGLLSVPSGALTDVPFSLAGRATLGPVEETNPEELLASAHAGCFAMALSAQMTRRNAPPERLEVTVTVVLDEVAGRNRIVASRIRAGVTGTISEDDLASAVEEADGRCPFSALIRDAGGDVSVEPMIVESG